MVTLDARPGLQPQAVLFSGRGRSQEAPALLRALALVPAAVQLSPTALEYVRTGSGGGERLAGQYRDGVRDAGLDCEPDVLGEAPGRISSWPLTQPRTAAGTSGMRPGRRARPPPPPRVPRAPSIALQDGRAQLVLHRGAQGAVRPAFTGGHHPHRGIRRAVPVAAQPAPDGAGVAQAGRNHRAAGGAAAEQIEAPFGEGSTRSATSGALQGRRGERPRGLRDRLRPTATAAPTRTAYARACSLQGNGWTRIPRATAISTAVENERTSTTTSTEQTRPAPPPRSAPSRTGRPIRAGWTTGVTASARLARGRPPPSPVPSVVRAGLRGDPGRRYVRHRARRPPTGVRPRRRDVDADTAGGGDRAKIPPRVSGAPDARRPDTGAAAAGVATASPAGSSASADPLPVRPPAARRWPARSWWCRSGPPRPAPGRRTGPAGCPSRPPAARPARSLNWPRTSSARLRRRRPIRATGSRARRRAR